MPVTIILDEASLWFVFNKIVEIILPKTLLIKERYNICNICAHQGMLPNIFIST
jgi:hypothetical protein